MVHTSKIVSLGSLVGQVEKLMLVSLSGSPRCPLQFNLTDQLGPGGLCCSGDNLRWTHWEKQCPLWAP